MKKRKSMIIVIFVIVVLAIIVGIIVVNKCNLISIGENNNLVSKEENNSETNYEEKETDFKLVDQYGNKQNLIDYRGKKVVIIYWAVWCSPCKEEIPIIDELSKEYSDAEFLTVVSPTSTEDSKYASYQEEISAYIEENNITVPVLIDEDKKCFENFGIERYPTTIFIDENGEIKEKLGSKEQTGKLSKEEIVKKLEQY